MAFKCLFCSRPLLMGRGKMYVQIDGRVFYFDKPKCERNWRLGRDGLRTKWTPSARKFREKKP